MNTNVIFRKFIGQNDIIALFPYNYEGSYKISSYMHLGQHVPVDYDQIVKISIPAMPFEYESLKNELINIGYNLNIIGKALKQKMYKNSKY